MALYYRGTRLFERPTPESRMARCCVGDETRFFVCDIKQYVQRVNIFDFCAVKHIV